MAKDESKRLSPAVVQADRDSLTALGSIAGYKPANSAFSSAAMETALAELDAAQQAEVMAAAALASARDTAVAKEWALHNKMIGMKDQVVAQFGRDSNEAQSVGRKKPSERKAPQKKSGQAAK